MNDYKWWQKAVFYQIYPRSFADGNGDGIGDFMGMTAKLPYLKKLGIDAIWLSPHYPSPQADCGYDVSDYVGVAPEYGSLDDFKEYLKQAPDYPPQAQIQEIAQRLGAVISTPLSSG